MKNCSNIEKKGKLGGERKKGGGKRKEGRRRERKLGKEGRQERKGQTDQSLLTCETQASNLDTYVGVSEGAEEEEAGYNV